MHPVLLSGHLLGREVTVSGYGVALSLGFLVAVVWVVREAERRGLDWVAMRDLCFWLVLVSLVGARALFVAVNAGAFVELCRDSTAACGRPLALWEGGLVFYGGVIAAAAFVAWWSRRRGLPLGRVADLLAPAVALGHAFGRVGCFLAGCCWGAPSSARWAVAFPPESLAFEGLVARGQLSPAAAATPPLHPVQLYEAAGELALFAVLARLGRPRSDGRAAAAWLAAYAALRFAVETVRGDPARGLYGPLALSQWIALACGGAALAWLARDFSRR